MASVTFDTLKYVEHLEKSGIPREHASAIANAQKESLSEVLDSTLATKQDIQSLKLENKENIQSLKLEMSALKGEMTSIKWMMGVLVGVAIANFAKQFF
jgi:hypothetical protein